MTVVYYLNYISNFYLEWDRLKMKAALASSLS